MVRCISLFLILFVPYFGLAQDGSLIANTKTSNVDFKIKSSFIGLWEVKLVTVGAKSMTPVAKWFQINKDGTVSGGNGWTQNVESEWEFNDASNTLLFVTDDIADEYGPFTISVKKTKMTWARNEEGQTVEVHLNRVDKKPLAPWDKIIAIWKWTGMESRNVDTDEIKIYDVEPDWTRIRWDRQYDTFDATGKKTESGIWHFDAHRPILTIFDGKDEKFVWQIEFIDEQMVWTKESDNRETILTFEKSDKIGN